MSDDNENNLDKTSVVASETLQRRLDEAEKAPPAIVMLMGPAKYVGRQWLLNLREMVVGRTPDCHVFVEDRSVSKRHGRFIVDGGHVKFEDFSSTNGTEINDQPIAPQAQSELRNNDRIKCGSVIFKFLESGNIETFTHKNTYDRTQVDPLTQIFNKGALMATGEETVVKALQGNFPVTVIVFDLDNFKSINDTHGHAAGDFVLREMSSLIQNQLIRSEDFFARFGGEEFCLILSGSPLQRGVDVAERIRSTVDKYEFKYNEKRLPVTVSMGVAQLTPAMKSWDELFEQADKASYLSKQGGKNRVSTI
ncbi:MAG: diguanylate cyclase [Bdellovibrionales bacterium]|nr:diguanylate cyclase [Bdellovibrionales bacterium]